ncbi:hypothetical protein [Burkholderia gladioli]|uniref:hypothetical protein n=1 Tax=Burkholderia gladioli TaxID=28095 RepID=UPI00163E2354|nr:hypothetical protein [Burkholderia gladioli]
MLKKSLTVKASGVPATIHVADNVAINYATNRTNVDVTSFYNEDAQANGLTPLNKATVTLEGIPAAGQDARDFAEAELIKAAPAGTTVKEVLESFGMDRYAFQGATLAAATA